MLDDVWSVFVVFILVCGRRIVDGERRRSSKGFSKGSAPSRAPPRSTHSCSSMHCSCASSSTRSNWRRRLVSAPLSPPPDLFEYASSQEHAAPPATSDKEKLDNLFGKNKKDGTVGTVKHQKSVGNVGSKTRDRAHLYHTLAVGGSTPQENLDATLMRLVYGLCFLLWSEYGERVVCDSRWCGAFAAARARGSHYRLAKSQAGRLRNGPWIWHPAAHRCQVRL